MRILLVNKFHYFKGGSEKYYFELGELLKKKGHEVAYFSMKNEMNITTSNKEYFVEEIDFNTAPKSKALSVIRSTANAKVLENAINEFKPEIIHVNNFQRQLSASVIEVANKYQIPVIYTAHDLQAICPAIVMLDSENNVCEKCIRHKYLNCVKNNCCKGSKLKSALGTLEAYYYKYNKIYESMNTIITPSAFFKEKMICHGFTKEKIKHLPNFLMDIESYNVPLENKGYFLYVGRISREKGVFDLLKAAAMNKSVDLVIAGTGPEVDAMQEYMESENIQDRVRYVGFLNQEEVKGYVSGATALVIPSTWYENCPYSLIEAVAVGKPTIGANIGGIPEIIENGINGLLFEPGNYEELAHAMDRMKNNTELYNQFSVEAKRLGEKYAEDLYYKEIYKVYQNAVRRK